MTEVSGGAVRKVQAMRSGTGSFDIDDFVSQLLSFMRDVPPGDVIEGAEEEYEADDHNPPLRWDKIGRKALAKSHRVPVMDFM